MLPPARLRRPETVHAELTAERQYLGELHRHVADLDACRTPRLFLVIDAGLVFDADPLDVPDWLQHAIDASVTKIRALEAEYADACRREHTR